MATNVDPAGTAATTTNTAPTTELPERISTGIPGLDEALGGGLLARRRYLVRGGPGLGKTTLGLKFLTAGRDDEAPLFIGFQEPEAELRANATSVGIDVSGIRFLSLAPTEEFFTEAEAYDVFAASDVEQAPMINAVVKTVEETRPRRVFVDSMTQLRFVSADLAQYRKQVMSFLRFLTDHGSTVLFSSESSAEVPDDDLQFISDGIIELQQAPWCGTLTIHKFRGSGFLHGRHQFRVDEDGFSVFPRILPPPKKLVDTEPAQLPSGNKKLDDMLHGGLETGTITLITGPTGIGKSTLAGLFAVETARIGKTAAVYQFEEEINSWMSRMRALGIDVDTPIRTGSLKLEQVEPLCYLADEFTNAVRRRVKAEGVELVVIDSITGFKLALAGEQDYNRPLHAFVKTLSRLGASVMLIHENQAVVGGEQISESEVSYIADNVIYLRYVQSEEALERILGILKKRLSGFDTRQHQFAVAQGGIRIGDLAADLGLTVDIGDTPLEQT